MLAPETGDVSSICSVEGVMTFDMIYRYTTLLKIYKILNANHHVYFVNKVLECQVEHSHSTRFRTNESIQKPFYVKTKCQNSFLYRGIEFWNLLPFSLRNTESNVFKKKLKEYII